MRSGTNASPAGGKMNAAGGTENQNTYMVQQVEKVSPKQNIKKFRYSCNIAKSIWLKKWILIFKNKDFIIHKYYHIYLV